MVGIPGTPRPLFEMEGLPGRIAGHLSRIGGSEFGDPRPVDSIRS
jgi:hypothetical protein